MGASSFIAGVACGAIIAVTAGWFLTASEEHEEVVKTQSESIAASGSDLKSVEPIASNASKPQAGMDNSRTTEIPTTDRNGVKGASPWPTDRWQELELEPKDDSWAYYMEQTLLHFLGSHPATAQFSISRIDCRTTRCQLEVVGYDESTVPVWQQVMHDIRQQPWSEFGQYETSSGDVDGSLILIGTLSRQLEQE